jgi:hypothetical protein
MTTTPIEFEKLFGSFKKKPLKEHGLCSKCGHFLEDRGFAFFCKNKTCTHYGLLTVVAK